MKTLDDVKPTLRRTVTQMREPLMAYEHLLARMPQDPSEDYLTKLTDLSDKITAHAYYGLGLLRSVGADDAESPLYGAFLLSTPDFNGRLFNELTEKAARYARWHRLQKDARLAMEHLKHLEVSL